MQTHSMTRATMLILALALGAGGCGRAPTPQEHIAKANDYFVSGELQSASIELANALQQEPDNVDARWLLARVSLAQGDAARAERDARRAMEQGIAQGEARLLLVRAILLQGDADRAIAEATSLPPDLPAAQRAVLLGLRSQAHVLKGDLDDAQFMIDDALSLDPDCVEALVARAVIYTLRRQYDEAEEWATRALAANDRSADAWSALGELELARGNAAEAETAFGNAIKNRDFANLDRARRALARLQLEKFEEAEADIVALGRHGLKNHPYVNHVLGLVRFGQRNYRDAAAAFEATHAMQPNLVQNRMYLGIAHYFLGNLEQARHHAAWVQANAPRSGLAAQLLGVVSANLSDYTAANDALSTALRNSPDDSLTLQLLTNVSLLAGRTEAALEYATRLTALEPQSEQARESLMVARLMTGRSLNEPGVTGQPPDGSDDFTREFLLALEAFRDNRIGEALDSAARLHERFPDKVDPLNLLAAVHLARGQWDEAEVELEKVLQLDPDNAVARRNLAKIELQAGDPERATTLLRPLAEQFPTDEELALLLARAHFQLGDETTAVALLERLLEQNDNALSARSRLAAAHLSAGRLDRVLELTQGLGSTQLRQVPELLEVRGKALTLAGDVAAARSTFEQWVRLVPTSAPAHFYLSDSLAKSGDIARAHSELQRALELDRQYLPARVGEIKMLVQRGQVDLARKALDDLRSDFGERTEVLSIEGWFALGTGEFALAEERFRTMLEHAPHTDIITLLSRALWAQGEHDAAIAHLEAWLRERPADIAVQLLIADAYLAQGRANDARMSYKAVLVHQPEHIVALNNLAWLTRETEPTAAMDYAQRAHQLAPENPHVLDTLGMLLLERGDVTRASRFVSEAAERAPDDLQIRLHLGRVLIRQNRLDEARKVLNTLIEEAPDRVIGREAQTEIDSLKSTAQ